MIQRIQSLFLLLATGALGGQFFAPYLCVGANDPARAITSLSDGMLTPLDNPGLLGLTGLGALISLIAIFLFKNRPLQSRLALSSAGICVMITVLLAFTTKMTLDQTPEGGSIQFAFGVVLPALAIIFNWLAARAIRKDEILVRSMDRLR
ncbi:MAG: DUF4293 domain-containing protein [Saprospiraceae bacterium]|jgi:hypothetical protein|nr:DUF4293 domain-containing protein [Saprospiraceae bacterium]